MPMWRPGLPLNRVSRLEKNRGLFWQRILLEDGSINRAKLGAIVFNDEEKGCS